jgi:hypothetical protein
VATAKQPQWKDASDVASAKNCVNFGVAATVEDARRVIRHFSQEHIDELVAHLAQLFVEREGKRLEQELVLELYMLLLNEGDPIKIIPPFLEAMLQTRNADRTILSMVELVLTSESTDSETDSDLYSLCVSFVCELGLSLKEFERQRPGEFKNAGPLLDRISTHLLSVSNSNSVNVRLSLLNYFGEMEADRPNKEGFNKVISRFGHTILEHLFDLLFQKKSEGHALQYILQNLPYILQGDNHTQRIVHETWKFYMLKVPDRFGMFLQSMSVNLAASTDNSDNLRLARSRFVQHLGALLNVVSEVNHRELTREIITALLAFRNDPVCENAFREIQSMKTLRDNVLTLLHKVRDPNISTENVVEAASKFITSKRGRKPSFQKVDSLYTIELVRFLGAIPITQRIAS